VPGYTGSILRTGTFWAVAALMSNLCPAQDVHPDIPPFSHYATSAQGWTCDDGYKQVAGFCVQDKQDPPGQDGVEVYEGEWRCVPGYRRTNGVCALPTAPEHASLVGTSGHWECDWGFKKVAEHCEEIVPPAHGFLDAEGRDWTCFPGYEREADRCVSAGTSQAPSTHE
jgi:hypothetical protein